jgi:hypothetical protein
VVRRFRVRPGFVCIAVAVVAAGCATASTTAHACTPVPRSYDHRDLLTNGQRQTARVGTIIYVGLVQCMTPGTPPQGFPWQGPQSSDRHVLAPLRMCPDHGSYSLNTSVSGFRAAKTGQASITAALTPAWRGNVFRAYQATVVVHP